MRRTFPRAVVAGLFTALCAAASGCEAEPVVPDAGGGDASSVCRADGECDDGIFCNGQERCDPTHASADGRGCRMGAPPCEAGACDEAGARCEGCDDPDADGDGFVSVACGGDDCDDTRDDRFPGNAELCDAIDQDCDPTTFGARDGDDDGRVSDACCDPSGDTLLCGPDCDDSDPSAGLAFEICDGRDNDCDGAVDESTNPVQWYPDRDDDGHGDPEGETVESCTPVAGHSMLATDCDDDDPAVRHGAVERCNGRDDDCDDALDEGSSCTACTDDTTPCEGGCRPSSFFTSTSHCGSCGNACSVTGAVCDAGDCVCPAGLLECAGACREESFFLTEVAHCGTCGEACADYEVCVGGGCECDATATSCEEVCRPPEYFQTSGRDCGACGEACTGPCSAAACVGVLEVSLGMSHGCARLTDGTVRCWGDNDYGQVGDGSTDDRLTPVVVHGLTDVIDIAVYGQHSCAVIGDGTARCWGNNQSGQLGDDTKEHRSTPVAVVGLTDVAEVAPGLFHTCARRTDGTARCWGRNVEGQLHNGTAFESLTPTPVVGITGVVGIASGERHACAVIDDGSLRCWGSDWSGRLDGNVVTGLGTEVAEVAAGSGATCARMNDGTVRCWGSNGGGQLGDGTNVHSATPVTVAGLTDVVDIDYTRGHGCARRLDGSVWCWGGTWGYDAIASPLTDAVGVAVGWSFACAPAADAAVACTGSAIAGRLGDGTSTGTKYLSTVLW